MVGVAFCVIQGKEFALELLKAANVRIPEERVFGLGSGRKGQVRACPQYFYRRLPRWLELVG